VPGEADDKVRRYWEMQAGLPEKHNRDWLAAWEKFRASDPTVHEAERAKYNELAARTRTDNPVNWEPPLQPDDLGRTFVRYPDARRLEELPAQRPIGPLPAGAMPHVRMTVRPGAKPQVAEHEQLHVQGALPIEQAPMGVPRPALPDLSRGLTPDWYKAEKAYWDGQRRATFEKLSPRERELWRVYKALRNEEAPHDAHDSYSVDTEPADKDIAIRQAALRERVKGADGIIAEAELRLSKLRPGTLAHTALLGQRDALLALTKKAQKP
jgi:hypothetical protein